MLPMKFNFSIVLFLACLAGFSQYEPPEKLSDTIFWNTNRPLVFEDFQAAEDLYPKEIAQGFDALSEISILLIWNSKDIADLNVSSFFIKSKSWINKEGKENTSHDQLLVHEYLHFTLGELYARRLKKLLVLEYDKGRLNRKKVEAIYKNSFKAFETATQLFDAETYHGVFGDKQELWMQRLSREIEELEGFK